MKLLLSAYACEPGKGSEPEVGLRAVEAAAQAHEVWVLTRRNNLESLQSFVDAEDLTGRVHLVGVEASVRALELKARGVLPIQLYYELWQKAVARTAIDLDQEIDFDLVHHVTFASYWGSSGVAALPKPMVWGPVGGGVSPPNSLRSLLGWRGTASRLARATVRPPLARLLNPLHGRTGRTLVLTQNLETIAKLGSPEGARVVTNGTSVTVPPPRPGRSRGDEIAFVGRLLPLKAGVLAIRVVQQVRYPGAVLVVYGRGPEESRMRALASRLGVEDRVRFEGALAREDLLDRVAVSGALLHVALHEESGLAVAEALALGTPVVCLKHGGPAELVQRWADSPSIAVPPGDLRRTELELAEALDSFLANPPPIPSEPLAPSPTFQEELLRAYEDVTKR
jgi:glycosyltransferase involved in cell wall biosynthesis